MSEEISKRSVFEAKLIEVYQGELTPLNHKADQIRFLARKALGAAQGYGNYDRRLLAGGLWIVESCARHDTQLNGEDVSYSLAIPEYKVTKGKLFKRFEEFPVETTAISLLINHGWETPAALISPGSDEVKDESEPHRSATVVVYDEANNPDHLEDVLSIVQAIGKATPHFTSGVEFC